MKLPFTWSEALHFGGPAHLPLKFTLAMLPTDSPLHDHSQDHSPNRAEAAGTAQDHSPIMYHGLYPSGPPPGVTPPHDYVYSPNRAEPALPQIHAKLEFE